MFAIINLLMLFVNAKAPPIGKIAAETAQPSVGQQ